MKRSEMIKQIHDRLNGTPIDHNNYADQFLTVVEELGMLPPSIRLNATNEFTTLSNLDILHDYDCSFAWQDEDETR